MKFCKHLKEYDANYFEHLKIAFNFAFQLIGAAIILMIHAVFPFWFEYKGSDIVNKISKEFKIRKNFKIGKF